MSRFTPLLFQVCRDSSTVKYPGMGRPFEWTSPDGKEWVVSTNGKMIAFVARSRFTKDQVFSDGKPVPDVTSIYNAICKQPPEVVNLKMWEKPRATYRRELCIACDGFGCDECYEGLEIVPAETSRYWIKRPDKSTQICIQMDLLDRLCHADIKNMRAWITDGCAPSPMVVFHFDSGMAAIVSMTGV